MKTFFASLATVLVFAAAAVAAPLPMDNDRPVDVTSDSMVYNSDKNTVVFQGSVEATRGTFKLWAETITIFLRGGAKQKAEETAALASAMGGTDLDRIVAENNVRFKNGAQHGSAQKATYFARPNTLVLEGNPTLHDGDNSISGNVIRYFVNENRSVVEGGSKRRVHAVFSGGDKKKGN